MPRTVLKKKPFVVLLQLRNKFLTKMPLQEYIITEPHGRLGIWHITEDEDFFLKKLPLTDTERTEIEATTGRKKLEKLAGKMLLQQLTGWTFLIIKNENGKPFFKDSNLHISLSHSGDYVAGIVSDHVVGIDIQYLTDKVERVAWRVMNEVKFKSLDPNNRLEHLHVYWGAKEALFKTYGHKAMDFRKHLVVTPFAYMPNDHSLAMKITEGSIEKDNRLHWFDIYYQKIKNYILVYAIEKTD